MVVCIGTLSIILTSMVAYLMVRNPELLNHPNKLIFYMCICEGIIAWQSIIAHLGTAQWICYFRNDILWRDTTFWSQTESEAIATLQSANFNVLCSFEYLSLSLNFFLCLDIVLTMRNPFYPHDRRMKNYLIGSVLIAATCFLLSLRRVEDGPHQVLGIDTHYRALFSVGFLSLYILFAIVSVAYAWRVNTRPGMSTEVRKRFIVRHTLYVVCYIATWLPFFGFAYFVLYCSVLMGPDVSYVQIGANPATSDDLHLWMSLYNYSCMCTGILMTFVRISEPIFWVHIKETIY